MNKLLVLFLLVFAACNPLELYDPVIIKEQFHSLEDGWHHENSLTFTFSIDDTNATYNIVFTLRHTRNYPYRNIWLQSQRITPSGETLLRRHEIYLSTPAGIWFGTELGHYVFQQERMIQNTRFTESGEYTLVIRHDMRDDHLAEVVKSGIRVEKNSP